MSPLSSTTAVIGFDGSPASERAARRAAEAVAPGGRVVLVVARPSLMSAGLAPEALLDDAKPGEHDATVARGRQLLQDLGIDPHVVQADGEPAGVITGTASAEAADLIVVGATGTGYVARAILGSTPAAILRAAPCDVLVVR